MTPLASVSVPKRPGSNSSDFSKINGSFMASNGTLDGASLSRSISCPVVSTLWSVERSRYGNWSDYWRNRGDFSGVSLTCHGARTKHVDRCGERHVGRGDAWRDGGSLQPGADRKDSFRRDRRDRRLPHRGSAAWHLRPHLHAAGFRDGQACKASNFPPTSR